MGAAHSGESFGSIIIFYISGYGEKAVSSEQFHIAIVACAGSKIRYNSEAR